MLNIIENFPILFDSKEKVKELRNLILSLAIQGKLVPQDPKDEPASMLLNKIKSEKENHINHKKIKRGKPLPVISDEEKPFDIHNSWEWVRLGEFLQLINGDRGKNYPSKDKLSTEGIPFISAINIQNGEVISNNLLYLTQEQYNKLGGGKLNKNDIVFCIRGSLGKNAIYKFENGAIASSLVILRQYKYRDKLLMYLYYYLNSPILFSEIKKYDNGTAQPNLSAENLKKFLFPMPPLSEQHRIVQKIDELMVLCDELEKALEKKAQSKELVSKSISNLIQKSENQEQLKANLTLLINMFKEVYSTKANIKDLRDTILQLAIQGRLVPQDPKDEPASVLLKQIEEEKKRLVRQKKKSTPLPHIKEHETPFKLPKGWEWTRLGTIISISSGEGLTKKQMNDNGEIPVYGGNGITGYHNLWNINQRTVVVGRVGFHCGCVHLTEEKAWITDNAFVTAYPEKYICRDWLVWLLKGTNLKEKENATAQPVISGKKIYPIIIPLPPLSEQHRIVQKVDELMALCGELEKHIEDTVQHSDNLMKSIIKTAI